MATSKAVPRLLITGVVDKQEKYALWKQRLVAFQKTSAKAITAENLQYYIVEALDDEGLKMFNSFGLTDDELKVPSNIFAKFEERLKISKPNFRAARLELHFLYQMGDESVVEFYLRFKQSVDLCEFTDDQQKERFIEQLLASNGIEDYRKFLLSQEKDVKLDQILQEGRKHEIMMKNLKRLTDRGVKDAIRSTEVLPVEEVKTMCEFCGRSHGRNCPAFHSFS